MGLLGGKLNGALVATLVGLIAMGGMSALADGGAPGATPAPTVEDIKTLDGPEDITGDVDEANGEPKDDDDVAEDADDVDEDTNEDTNEDTVNEEVGVDEGPGNGHDSCFPATEHARSVIQGLLEERSGDEGANDHGLSNALESIENCGTGGGSSHGNSADGANSHGGRDGGDGDEESDHHDGVPGPADE